MTALCLPYIAGLFDADGSVSLAKRTRRSKAWGIDGVSFVPVVSFSQSDLGLLTAVAKFLDGSVQIHSEAGGANSYGVKRNRTSYQIAWSNKAAIRVASVLIEHVHARKAELQVLQEFHHRYANFTKGAGRGAAPTAENLARRAELLSAGDAARQQLQLIRKHKNTIIQ